MGSIERSAYIVSAVLLALGVLLINHFLLSSTEDADILEVKEDISLPADLLSAQGQQITMTVVSQITTTTSSDSLDYAANKVYVGIDDEFRVYDATDPANLVHIGSYTDTTNVRLARVSGSHAYIIDSRDKLSVLDVSTPATITALTTFTVPTYLPLSMVISGTHLYLGEQANPDMPTGLRVYDISTPSSPTEVDFYPLQELSVNDMAIRGSQLFAALQLGESLEFGELQIFDVSDPSSTELVGDYVPYGSLRGVAAGAQRAFVTVNSVEDNFAKLRYVDISATAGLSTTEVSEGGTFNYPNHDSIDEAPIAHRILTNNNGNEIVSVETRYVMTSTNLIEDGVQEHIRLIDVSNPVTPTSIVNIEIADDAQAYDLVVDNDYVFVAAGEAGLVVVRIVRP